jgi:ribonuclease HI
MVRILHLIFIFSTIQAKMDHQDNLETNARLFEPHKNLNHLPDDIKAELYNDPEILICFDRDLGVSNLLLHLPLKKPPYISRIAEAMDNTIVIAIDGALRTNGTTTASFGIFFGNSSPYNMKGLVPKDLPQTSQSAQLYAFKTALDVFLNTLHSSPEFKSLDTAVIMTDSPYLNDGLTKDIWKWESNGYMTARKTPVAHSDRLKELHELMKSLEAEKNITVGFWLVDRQYNEGADRLANEALGPEGGKAREAKKRRRPKKSSSSGSGNGSASGRGSGGQELS